MKRYVSAFVGLTLTAVVSVAAQQSPSPVAKATLKPGEVAVIGCLQREADYRALNNKGAGGPLGTNIGTGNEYVLVKATAVPAATAPATKPGATRDFSLTGQLEKNLAGEVGRMVEVVGMLKEEEGSLPRLTVSLSHPVGDFCPNMPRQ